MTPSSKPRDSDTSKFVSTAPDYFKNPANLKKFNNGREILVRLLTDFSMESAWRQLARKVKRDSDWIKVWGWIATSKGKSDEAMKNFRPRQENRDEFRRLAVELSRMATKIQRQQTWLDGPVYEFLPADVTNALHQYDWPALTPFERQDRAHRLLNCWPNASEVILGLSELAAAKARGAMTEPRPIERQSGNAAVRAFVFHLGTRFKSYLGQPMYGTVAAIANSVFELREPISDGFVKSALLKGVAKGG